MHKTRQESESKDQQYHGNKAELTHAVRNERLKKTHGEGTQKRQFIKRRAAVEQEMNSSEAFCKRERKTEHS